MPRALIVKKVEENSSVIAIGKLEEGEIFIGREPDEGIAVDSESVSGTHGVFMRFKSIWCYKDLGSTNGSWVNGEAVAEGEWRIIRAGDVLQLATAAIRFSNEPGNGAAERVAPRSLVVFNGDDYLDEFPIPEYGRALVVGGTGADLSLEADIYELPSLIIERRGDKVVAFSVAKEIPFSRNNEVSEGLVTLKDGDKVTIETYGILFNEPVAPKSDVQAGAPDEGFVSVHGSSNAPSAREWLQEDSGGTEGEDSRLTNSPSSGRTQMRGVFGKAPLSDDVSETVGLDRHRIQSEIDELYGGSSNAHGTPSAPYSALEDKIIIGVGVLLLVILMLMFVYWAFFY